LAHTRVKAASKILMFLGVDNRPLAWGVPGPYYFDKDNTNTFYLHCDEPRTMLRSLSESVNNQLKNCNLLLQEKQGDLKDIIDAEPSEIESLLDKWKIISLLDEPPQLNSVAIENVNNVNTDEVDEIFDRDAISQEESETITSFRVSETEEQKEQQTPQQQSRTSSEQYQ
jgi:hypothetical protein